MASRVLVILGMHRSGTSVVTHWLQSCGLHVGERLLGPGIGNVEGHFEDLELYRFHRSWLERNRLPHTGFVDAPVPALTRAHRCELERMIESRNARFAAWAWKEPRTCLFLDTYRQLLPDAKYLVVFRGFRESVSSMILRTLRQKDHKYADRRGPQSWLWFRVRRPRIARRAGRFLKVWIFYNRQILALLREVEDRDSVVVCCASLLRDEDEVFDTLARRWGFPLHRVPFRKVYKPGLASSALDIEAHVEAGLLREARVLQAQLEALADGACAGG